MKVILASPREYYLLVISNAMDRDNAEEITKKQRAEMGGFFFPVERLLDSSAFRWQILKTSGKQHQVPPIVFQ